MGLDCHRDENTANADLGTCLDYTSRPQNNLGPDDIDFLNLYGVLSGNGWGLRTRQRWEENTEIDGEGEEQKPVRTLTSENRSYKDGRLLHRTDYGEVYEIDLGENRRVVTSVLF